MKLGRSLSGISIGLMVAAMLFPCFLGDALAFRGDREDYRGGEVVRGPRGNVYVGRAVGDRVAVLPDSATAVVVGNQTYYVDDTGIYYLPCDDDASVYCVVPDPQ
jgi:hypothetical protein